MGLPTRPSTSEALARVDSDIDGDDGPPHRGPAPLPIADECGSSGHSHTSSSHASADEGSVHGDDPVAPDPYPLFIDGMPVTRESHIGRGDFGLRVKCANPAHVNCSCYRSAKLWTEEFGVDAPTLFLKTWMDKCLVLDGEAHKRWRPGRQAIRLYVLANS